MRALNSDYCIGGAVVAATGGNVLACAIGDQHLALAWTIMLTGWAISATLFTLGFRRAR